MPTGIIPGRSLAVGVWLPESSRRRVSQEARPARPFRPERIPLPRHGPKVTQPATATDAALVAAAIARYGGQKATERATGVPQHRLSRASVEGKGRALSVPMRERLR